MPTGNVVFSDTTGAITLGSTALSSSTLVSGFSAPQSYSVATNPGPVVTGDFNNDGIADMAVVESSGNLVSVLLGKGDGTLQNATSVQILARTEESGAIFAGDFNGDGKLDLAIIGLQESTGNYVVNVLLGNGDGTFQEELALSVVGSSGSDPSGLGIGDFNGDGKLDLAVSYSDFNLNTGTSSWEVGILLGNGDGTFQPQVSFPTLDSGILVGDFNGDGRLDIAQGGSILLGNGNGFFQPPVAYVAAENAPYGVSVVGASDFNGDGKPDLALVNNWDESIDVLLGNGDGTFQSPLKSNFDNPVAAIVIGDFNGDGKPDLAGAYNLDNGNLISIVYGNGDGTFTASEATYPDGSYASPDNDQPAETSALAVGDFNGDGRVDLVAIGFNNNVASILLGQQLETVTLSGVSVPGSGTPSVNASYSGDTNYNPSSSSPIMLTASQIPTKLTLTASAPPSNSSQVTLVAVLSPASDGNLSTDGETITFLNGSTTIGTATLTSGVATLVTTSIPSGATNLTANYAGDANFVASQSAPTAVSLKATLIVTANSQSKQLNQPNSALTYTISGFVNGDTQASATTGAPALSTTATTSSPTGSYPITIAQGTLAASNYNFTFVNGTLTVVGDSQTITFPALSNVAYGPTQIALKATASSSLPVAYTVTGPGNGLRLYADAYRRGQCNRDSQPGRQRHLYRCCSGKPELHRLACPAYGYGK